MYTKEEFGIRLAKLRTAENISAREMSLAIGQNPSYINRIENNKAYPSMEVFFYICDYLKVNPGDFFHDDISYPKNLEALFQEARDLPLDQIKLLVQVAREFHKSKRR